MFFDPALTFAVALAAGMIAQTIAYYLRAPGIVVLLFTGVLLGPDLLGVIQPETLGGGLTLLVELAVAVILFDGALNLNLERIRQEVTTIRRLITLGAIITAVGGALAARLFMGWSWELSLLFGTLVIVTGPTVITPLLRRIRVEKHVHTILEAEGVFIDPVGAIVALVALEIVITPGPFELFGIPIRLLVGAVMGGIGGIGIGVVLRRKIVPPEWENVFTLAIVLALFEVTNAILPDSGIVAPVVAGLVVGNISQRGRALREFKEQLTVMLVSLLFVLLAADVRLAGVVDLGWGAVATVAALIFLVRPVAVAACARGSDLTWRERVFISWIGPRGIVAAAVASFFAVRLDEFGMAGGEPLRALVFTVIAVTVVLQGLTGGVVAQFLGVRRPTDVGYLVVGANALGRTLSRVLAAHGEDVILIDSNEAEAARARNEGLPVIFGNANDEAVLAAGDIEGRRGFVAVTSNEGVNLLLARRAREEFRVPNVYSALYGGRAGVAASQIQREGILIPFGRPFELRRWIDALERRTAALELWRFDGEAENEPLPSGEDAPDFLPLAIDRDGEVQPVSDETRVRRGDVVTFLAPSARAEVVAAPLGEAGWKLIDRVTYSDDFGADRLAEAKG